MKFLKHILLLLLVSVFFIQCKKNSEPEPVTFSGNVSDNVQGIPVANATVKIKLQQSASNSVFNSGFNTVATTTTDASGNYSMTFTPENPITYKVVIERNLYYGKEVEISSDVVTAGSNTVTNFAIDPIGWFKINIKNTNPTDADDNLLYQNTSETNGCSTCCNNLPISLNGMTVDTSFICQRVANPTISFSWFITKNGNTSPFSNSISSIIGDTVVYNLNY
jgi:hypothetical protein